jgi:hypothetical protein
MILKSKLVENVRKILGYDKEAIISVCKDLVKDGVLYEPDYMTYGLSCSLTDL